MSINTTVKYISVLALSIFSVPTMADWEPSGPIRLMVGFAPGGGTDSLARALSSEIEERNGWRVIPENVAGAGGAVMASRLKSEPNDGLTIGLALDTTFTFDSIDNNSISIDDYSYITTLAASQTGVIARADSGWKTMEDVVEASKNGENIVWSNYSSQTQLASEVISNALGIEANHLRGQGGRAGVDSLVAQDANLAWSGGAHRGLVAADELVILVSAENEPLVQNKQGETLEDLGIPYNFGFRFVLAAPAGLDKEARDAIAEAVREIAVDKESRTAQFIAQQYPPSAVIVKGEELNNDLYQQLDEYLEMLQTFGQ